mgnify:CR=1 FL=1
MNRLQAFGKFSRFKRMMMEMISLTLNPNQVTEMRDAFERIDTENTGVLSLEEFKTAMSDFPAMSTEKIEQTFKTIDQDEARSRALCGKCSPGSAHTSCKLVVGWSNFVFRVFGRDPQQS